MDIKEPSSVFSVGDPPLESNQNRKKPKTGVPQASSAEAAVVEISEEGKKLNELRLAGKLGEAEELRRKILEKKKGY